LFKLIAGIEKIYTWQAQKNIRLGRKIFLVTGCKWQVMIHGDLLVQAHCRNEAESAARERYRGA
jgi:hypothetical protein